MKAITQDSYGSADVLQLRDIEQPTPGDQEVVVKVKRQESPAASSTS